MNKSSMFKVLILFVLTLSSVATSRAAEFNKKSSIVLYSDTLDLTKEMFKATPLANKYEICTYFYFDYKIEQDSVIMNVYSSMDGNRSNPCKECRFEKWLLQHELYHFKITEVWARIFSSKISGKRIKKSKFTKYLRKQYEVHCEYLFSMQDLYDLETNHSKIKGKQKEWEQKIDQLLDKYKKYANKNVSIKLK